jgi:hypothetical protein
MGQPTKKKQKARTMTNEEVARRLFPKRVREEVKKQFAEPDDAADPSIKDDTSRS